MRKRGKLVARQYKFACFTCKVAAAALLAVFLFGLAPVSQAASNGMLKVGVLEEPKSLNLWLGHRRLVQPGIENDLPAPVPARAQEFQAGALAWLPMSRFTTPAR